MTGMHFINIRVRHDHPHGTRDIVHHVSLMGIHPNNSVGKSGEALHGFGKSSWLSPIKAVRTNYNYGATA
jgi:hypothetical protein